MWWQLLIILLLPPGHALNLVRIKPNYKCFRMYHYDIVCEHIIMDNITNCKESWKALSKLLI